MTWNQAFAWSAALAGVGSMLFSLQLLAVREEFDAGLLSWRVLRSTHHRLTASRVRAAADRLLSAPLFLALLAAHLVAAAAIVARPSRPPLWALVLALAGRALFNFRNPRAVIGADQMQLIVLGALLLAAVSPGPSAALCGWFVYLEMLLAYVTAGVSKLRAPVWRNGTAIAGLMRTRTFGLEAAHVSIERRPALAVAAAWATMLFEIAGPWLVFGGVRACVVFVITGVAFHLCVAIATGLDEFVWAFAATYPIALRCSMDVGRLWAS
jgi:hypothetical protein